MVVLGVWLLLLMNKVNLYTVLVLINPLRGTPFKV